MNGHPGAGSGDPTDVSLVRPYVMTSGSAQSPGASIEIEAQVLTTELGSAAAEHLRFELRDIVALCRRTAAVAEVAAVLGLHIGVARVLIAELADRGLVTVHRPDSELGTDPGTIERIIRGLEALR
ncbi:DUF742 domain-containing protein [Actinomycetes bacterium KLBMP 9759]